MDGIFAVLLWRDFRSKGNREALDTLLACNIRDAINLEPLLVKAYNLKAAQTPFGSTAALDLPAPPREPFLAHAPTLNRLLRQYSAASSW